MQASPFEKGSAPSTKAALDHLQLLIEQLLDENHNLKLSLRETRSQLDQVRAHLNSFKHDLAEHEKNDRHVRTHIRTMAALIERSRQPNLPITSTTLPPSLNPPSQAPPLLSVTSQSLPPSSAPSPIPPSPIPPSPSASSPRASSPRPPPSPKAQAPRAQAPSAQSSRAPLPSESSPRPPSPSAPSSSTSSLRPPSLKAPSPRALSPRAPLPSTPSPRGPLPSTPSPRAPLPSIPSPSAPTPRALTPRTPTQRTPTQRTPSPRTPTPRTPSPKTPPQRTPSPREPSPSPREPSPRESSPRESSPREPSLREPSPREPPPREPSQRDASPRDPSPRDPSPRGPSPREPSPRGPPPRPPSPSASLLRAPSPSASLLRAPSPSTPSLRPQSPRTPSPNTLSPGTTSRLTYLPLQKSPTTEPANLSHSPLPVASITKTQDVYASPNINGNLSTAGLASPSRMKPTPECTKHTKISRSRCISQSPLDVSTSPSSDTKSLTEKRPAPSTSVSDALQKAFVDMEKDTTNAVHVLHEPSHIVLLRAAQAGEYGVESVSVPPSSPRDTKLPSNPSESHGANGVHGEELHSVKKQSKGHARKRSLKAYRKTAEPSSPASDSALPQPTKQSSFTGANGRLKRSLTQTGKEAPKSPQHSAKKLAKTLALKRTKKGYKVSLGLSRDSQKSGQGSSDSSSSSSDSDSDSSGGPGCAISLSRPHNRPAKAQVSMEGGLSDLMSAARKLKETLAQRKENDENSQGSGSSGSDSEESESGNESSHATEENTDTFGIGNGSILSAAAAAAGAGTLCAVGSSDLAPESFPCASGIPKSHGIIGEQNNHLQGAQPVTQNHSAGWSTWQLSERSYPGTYGTTEGLPNQSLTAGFPRNPVVEPERRSSPDDLVKVGKVGMCQNRSDSHSEGPIAMSSGQGEDFMEHSPAAGKATESEVAEFEEDAEYPIIHEITHVPSMPQTASDEEKIDKTSTSRPKTSIYPKLKSTEFLTIHSCGSQLLRWKACPGSRYVDVSRGALAVKHPAAIAFEDGRIVIHGKMRILEPLRVEPSEANHYFASPIYPDGSFLPYVPVSGVGLHARPVHWDNSRYAHRSVQLSFPKEIFDTLALHVRRAYRKRDSSTHLKFPGAFLAGNRVRKVVKVEPDCSVNMTKLQRSPTKCSVAEAVAYTKKDIIGLALLYVSIDEPPPDRSSAEVRFGLHSMVAHHVSADRKR